MALKKKCLSVSHKTLPSNFPTEKHKSDVFGFSLLYIPGSIQSEIFPTTSELPTFNHCPNGLFSLSFSLSLISPSLYCSHTCSKSFLKLIKMGKKHSPFFMFLFEHSNCHNIMTAFLKNRCLFVNKKDYFVFTHICMHTLESSHKN